MITWTEEMKVELRELHAEGHAYREIGRRMGLTKNTISGAMDRHVHFTKRNNQPRKTRLEALNFKPFEVDGTRASSCQYPHGHPGEDGFHFCGKPLGSHRSYCEEHRALCYPRAMTEEEKKASYRAAGLKYKEGKRT